ncbi:MAG: hypothetical protein HYU52_04220 [Acidobacteria bacterium]|nr:hypothetical protein [Acidobacteriota bacterium]
MRGLPPAAVSLALALTLCASPVGASTLTIKVPYHSSVFEERGERNLGYALFTDERLVADVQLDVYRLPQQRSSSAHYEELMKLSADAWHERLAWVLVRSDNGVREQVELPAPRVVRNRMRDRGPNAPLPMNCDASTECRTFEATIDFGPLPAGSYVLSATIAEGVASEFAFDVRTGQEPRWRDVYLENKAIHAKTYDEYRTLTLERIRLAPEKVSLVWDLIDRSLQHGTLEKTRSYVAMVRSTVERRGQASGAKKIDTGRSIEFLRKFDEELGDYFAHRTEWSMSRDVKEFKYMIRSRRTGEVLREIRSDER